MRSWLKTCFKWFFGFVLGAIIIIVKGRFINSCWIVITCIRIGWTQIITWDFNRAIILEIYSRIFSRTRKILLDYCRDFDLDGIDDAVVVIFAVELFEFEVFSEIKKIVTAALFVYQRTPCCWTGCWRCCCCCGVSLTTYCVGCCDPGRIIWTLWLVTTCCCPPCCWIWRFWTIWTGRPCWFELCWR